MRKSLVAFIALISICLITNAQPRKIGDAQDSSGEITEFMTDENNAFLALGNELGVLTVLDFNTQDELFKARPHREPIKYIKFRSSKNEIITFTENEIVFSSLTDGAQLNKISIFDKIEIVDLNTNTDQLFILAERSQLETASKKIFTIDLESRKFDPIHNGSGVSDFKVSGDGAYLYIGKGTKIIVKNINLSLEEKTLQSKDLKLGIDCHPSRSDWLVSNDRLAVRYWKISTEKSYDLRWEAQPTTEVSTKIYKAWTLSNQDNLLFYSVKGLKVRDIKNPGNEMIINSPTGLEINQIRLSPDRSKILVQAQKNAIEIWSMGDAPSLATKRPSQSTATPSKAAQINSTDQIYARYKADIDKEMNLRAELFEPRGEFERSVDYEKRQAEAQKYKEGVLEYYRGVANREAEVERELELARLKIIADKNRTDSVRKASLYRDKIIGSYEEFYTRITTVGKYDADKEVFPITIDEMTHLVRVPFDEARSFKEGSPFFKVIGAKQLLLDAHTMESFNYKIITDAGKVFSFGKQKNPIAVSGDSKLLNEVLNRSIPSQPQTSGNAVTSNQVSEVPKNAVDNAIVKYFRKKKYHALLIAVDQYSDHRITTLDGPVNDAARLKNILSSKYTFDPENVTFLKNPTRTEIIEKFDNLQAKIGDEDNLLIFYAGHGIWDENLKQGFWLPSDSKVDSKAAWLSNAMIRDYIGGINAKHTLLVADACFSGGIFKMRDVFVENRASLELAKLPSRKAITSGALKTVPDKSVFIEYLIKRLEQNNDELLPTEQLFSSFKIAVMNNSEGQVPQYGDIQGAGDEGGDFVFLQREY